MSSFGPRTGAAVNIAPAPPTDLWIVLRDDRHDYAIAHRIRTRHDHTGTDCAITACGIHYRHTQIGAEWWRIPAGEMPLAEAARNHCPEVRHVA